MASSRLVSGEASLLGLYMAVFSLSPHVYGVRVLRTLPLYWGYPFDLIKPHLFKSPVSKDSHSRGLHSNIRIWKGRFGLSHYIST
jgi:hypothetical protein